MTKTDTIIGITYATRDDLKDIGYYGEPYEDIIRGLINDHSRLETLKEWFHLACEEKDELTKNMCKVFQIANNAIYFRDSSDYLTALYEICDVIKPGDETVGEKFIEEVGDVNNDQT